MRKLLVLLSAAALLSSCGTVVWSGLSWHKIPADGHRTGVTAPSSDYPEEQIGISNGEFYAAPSGKIIVGGATPKVAQIMYQAQPGMADLKTVIGRSLEGMQASRPESKLSNWTVDILMEQAEKATGIKVDVGIANFGGIRTSIPQGDVLKDDLVSMFPFKNYLAVVTLKGSRLREIFTQMARQGVQVVGGVKLVISNGALQSASVGGKALDDDKTYNVATIDFLMTGGDGYRLGDGALQSVVTDVAMIDAILPKVLELTAAGKTLDYKTDGRVTIIK
ncbi:MAG: 5'-nucleotidase C-terminal domain-containing protein [Bacteroidales bacterium]|nr:5'-nucleotidase C-terminal domain-containing protein [Bacteroidales bacterium]